MQMRWLFLKRALFLGSLAALFFSSTFVVNRVVTLHGASALWLASLRYLFTVPLLAGVLALRRELKPIAASVWAKPGPWLLWGTVGFGLFYLPITWAARWAPAWLVAGGWQITIVMGSLIVPLLDRRRIPLRELWPSGLILAGVALTEWSTVLHTPGGRELWALIPIAIAAAAYPLGNRKTMQFAKKGDAALSVYQRTFGMTLGSLPFWGLCMALGGMSSGWPSSSTAVASAAVALLSGVAATLLFFAATEYAEGRHDWLARIEATQSMEIFFTVLLASLLFGQPWPRIDQWLGLAVIAAGMLIHSLRPLASRGAPS
jgi:drug/metabolite transporter (DMT)-like permease